jgi:flagellar hook-associated protein 3 FlgL
MQVDPRYSTTLAQDLSDSSANLQTLTSELSSGLKVSKLSDDPVAVSANTELSSQLAGLDSFVQTANTLQGRLQVTDSTLGEVVSQLTEAISVATEGANGTLTTANQAALAARVSGIRDQVLSLANTSYQGSFLFSGTQGQTAPFALAAGSNPPVAVYSGDLVTSTIDTPSGQSLAVNLPGTTIFLAPGASVLGTLNQLVADLQSGLTSAVAADSVALSTALSNVSQQRSILGSSLSQIQSASSYAQTQAANVQVQQSDLLSIDTATVATNLQNAEVQHQALISVVSGLSQNDLFSYLK